MSCCVCGDLALVVELAWESGFRFAMDQERVAEAVDDAAHATLRAPQLSYEERVARRIAEMETWAVMVRGQIEAEAAGAPRQPWRCA